MGEGVFLLKPLQAETQHQQLRAGAAGSGFPVPGCLHRNPWLAGSKMKGFPSLEGILGFTEQAWGRGGGGRMRSRSCTCETLARKHEQTSIY